MAAMNGGHSFRGKVVVVTGASAGLGRAIVREFAREGADLALLARDSGRLEAAKGEVESAGGRAVALPTDVAQFDAMERAAAAAEEALGPVDVWVNNAMTSVFANFWEVTPEEFRRVTEVTYLGTVHGTHCALRRMRPRQRGVIVQVGSALAYRGIPLQSAYCGAKHAIQGFTEALRCELLHEHSPVRITMVQMPALNTPQFRWVKSRLPRKSQPVPPIYQPEVGARAVVWAAAHDRRELDVGGSTALVVQGNKIAPGLGDHYLAETGVDAQMTDEPEDPERPDNLWHAVPGDVAAHGVFDARAIDTSLQLRLVTSTPWTAARQLVDWLAARLTHTLRRRPPDLRTSASPR